MKTKLLSLLLVLLMLFPLAACNKNRPTENGKGTTPSANGSNENPSGGTGGGNDEPDAPISMKPQPTDLEDFVYRVCVRSAATGNGGFFVEDFWVEKQTADAISYSTFARNQVIERDFNCSIVQVNSAEDQATQLRNAYFGGGQENTFEGAIALAKDCASTLAAEGILEDLNTLGNLHLAESYWDANSAEQLALGGKLYFVSGDCNISTLDNAVATVFNQDLLRNYDDLKSPYDMVRDGEWTMANMMEMADQVTSDLNQNGSIDFEDRAGYFTYATAGLYYFYGAGERISTTDATGYPTMTVLSATSVDVVDGLFRMLNPAFNKNAVKGASKERKAMFEANKVLFTDVTLWDVRKQLRPMTVKYGIVPIPIYSSTQKNYHSVVYFQDCVNLWTIPKTYSDLDKASLMMEVFASYSTDTTMNTYYNQVLSYHATKDPESIEMLDIVKRSQTYDVALLYDWGGFLIFLRNISGFTENGFAGKCDSALTGATNAMNETLKSFRGESSGGN